MDNGDIAAITNSRSLFLKTIIKIPIKSNDSIRANNTKMATVNP